MSAPILPHHACLRYGLLGLPLAFVAMPLYVVLPAHYGGQLGVPLGWLGGVLLGTRLADAFIDPWLGRWADRWLARPARAMKVVWLAAVLLALGFAALFYPPDLARAGLLAWCAGTMLITFAAYSVGSVLYLAWGARLGGAVGQRARLVAWREGLGLLGVVLANVLAAQAGLGWTTVVLGVALAVGAVALQAGPRPASAAMAVGDQPAQGRPSHRPGMQALSHPWRRAGFRRLMALFLINGVASAVPATLVLFFIQDRLQASPAWSSLFLGGYFLLAAASVPWWLRRVARLGLMRAWAMGMVLSIVGFLGVFALETGDHIAFLLICLVCGWALGADLTVPGALLAGVVQRAGDAGQGEGAYAGWWQWATKLNLALAAGLALPLLQLMGYAPGARDAQSLQALVLAYGALPCVFKLLSLALCWRWRQHPQLG
ncbi:MAG: MFS transporter [Aquabacterium sp.]